MSKSRTKTFLLSDVVVCVVHVCDVFLLFTDVPEHATKLQRLSQIHIKEQVAASFHLYTSLSLSVFNIYCFSLQDQTEAQSQEVKKLFEEYNKMVHVCCCSQH